MTAVRAAGRRRHLLGGALLAAIAAVAWALAISSGGCRPNDLFGCRLDGASASRGLFADIPQHGAALGRSNARLQIIEFADLQCRYCREHALHALPSLVGDYVRAGKMKATAPTARGRLVETAPSDVRFRPGRIEPAR